MTDTQYMKLALDLAAKGRTSPNPKVGALIVRDGMVVGSGFHMRAGEPHAEVIALREAGEAARGADLYVTLEPCCHHGRTPPCVDAIIFAGVSRVVAAMADPDEKVSGKGFDKLRSAGITVESGVCEAEARQLNEGYIKHRTTGLPFVVLKSAMSLDGKVATRTGDSKWITNERSRAYAHKIRSEVDAIVIGAGTLRADNPALTARVGKWLFTPTRVVLVGSEEIPRTSKMFMMAGDTILAVSEKRDLASLRKLERPGVRILTLEDDAGRPSIGHLMRELGNMGCLSVLIEGGSEVAASALEARVVDKVVFFYAPKIIGGRKATGAIGGSGAERIEDSITVESVKIRHFGSDFAVECYILPLPQRAGEGRGEGGTCSPA